MNNTINAPEKKSMTNGERLRSMANEELAWELMEFRFDAVCSARGGEAGLPNTQKAICEWLNQPAPQLRR